MRYVPRPPRERRSALASDIRSSVVKEVQLVDKTLFVIGDAVHDSVHGRITSLAVLKIQTNTGAIIKQALVTAPDANFSCSDVVSAERLLVISCGVQRRSSTLQSFLIAMDRELTLFELPMGFIRHGNDTFAAEALPIRATPLTVSTSSAQVQEADTEPIYSSPSPSPQPTSVTTTSPSAQPSSCPTSSPSTSAHPTSRPSTSGPTSSQKPTFTSTVRPSVAPSALSTERPTAAPSSQPTAPPSVHPTTRQPSAGPSVLPTGARLRPSVRPSRAPTVRPTRGTDAPSRQPTAVNAGSDSGGKEEDLTTSYAIAASAGGAVCLALYGWHVMYRRRLRSAKNKVAGEKSTKPLQSEHRLHGVGATAWLPPSDDISDTEKDMPVLRALSHSSNSVSSSSCDISSLHTSERSAEQ